MFVNTSNECQSCGGRGHKTNRSKKCLNHVPATPKKRTRSSSTSSGDRDKKKVKSSIDDVDTSIRCGTCGEMGHERRTNKKCKKYRKNLTHYDRKTQGIRTITMALKSALKKPEVHSKIEYAVENVSRISIKVMLFLNLYWRFCLSHGIDLPLLDDNLLTNVVYIVTGKNIKHEAKEHNYVWYFENEFRSIMGTPEKYDPKHKNIVAQMKKELLTISKNHIVCNIHGRFKKLFMCIVHAKSLELNIQTYGRKLGLQWICNNLIRKLTYGEDLTFSLPDGMTTFSPANLRKYPERKQIFQNCQFAFEEIKSYLGDLSLKPDFVDENWMKYFPAVYRIQLLFQEHKNEWKQLSPDEQRTTARSNFRSGAIVNPFPLLPEMSMQKKFIFMDSYGLCELLGRVNEYKKIVYEKRETRDLFRSIWEENFKLPSKNFHYTARTDGCSIQFHVVLPKLQPKSIKQTKQENSDEDNEAPFQWLDEYTKQSKTRRLLSPVKSEQLTGKTIITVDPGKNEIITAGYFQTSSKGDDLPLHLNKGQQIQFKSQRKWKQRHNRRKGEIVSEEASEKRKKKKERRKKFKRKKKEKKKKKKRRHRKKRRSYGHYFQVSYNYWSEITGIRRRQKLNERWQETNKVIKDLNNHSIPRFRPSEYDYKEYVKFSLENLDTRIGFYGSMRWRRLRLDKYICLKRAEGEIRRRFYPANIPLDKIIVLWGDGKFAHNLSGTPTSPKFSIQKIIQYGHGGRQKQSKYELPVEQPDRKFTPFLFLPGYEHKSSRQCSDCKSDLKKFALHSDDQQQQAKIQKQILKCINVGIHGREKFWQRDVNAVRNILKATLSLIRSAEVPEYLS